MLTIDASVALSWRYEREKPDEIACSDRALQAFSEMSVMVPTLWYTEVANALLTGERRKIMTHAQSIEYPAQLSHLPVLQDEVALPSRQEAVMAPAREHHLTACNVTYPELALRSGRAIVQTLSTSRDSGIQYLWHCTHQVERYPW